LTSRRPTAYLLDMAAVGISALQLITEINTGRFRPVYFFHGEEDYRKAEAVKYIVGHYLPEAQRILNFTRMTVDKTDFQAICAELAALPMLGERRLIFVDEVQRLKPTQQQKLFALLASPPPETVVILNSPAEHTPKKTSAFFRDVSRIAEPVEFGRLGKESAALKITKTLEAARMTCDPEAVQLLAELTDGDFGGLVGEIEKLSLSAEGGAHIGVAEVKALASSYEQFTMFELTDAVVARDREKAVRIFNDLTNQGERPDSFLWPLSNHFMNLLKANAGKRINGAPFYVRKLEQQARQLGAGRLERVVSRLAQTGREIRRSKMKAAVLVENLIRDISA